MFCRALFICSILAGSVSLASHAQTASRFYAGVGANLLTNVPFNSANVSRLVGPSLTVGVQVASCVALQTAATYQWKSESYTSPICTYGGDYIGGETSSSRYRYITVPVLLRYTVTPAARHFLFDGLAGITIRHSTHQQSYANPYSSAPFAYEINDRRTTVAITLGPAVRYAPSSNVESTANGLVSTAVGSSYSSHFGDRFFLNVLVGAQYLFGQR
jgi:hypothetical protein